MIYKILIFCAVLMSSFGFAQANYELSTLRIGPFHLKMDVADAEIAAGKKLKYDSNFINYHGEIIEVYVYDSYDSDTGKRGTMGSMKTTSRKFRTKSGVGVGSTRDQLIDAYRNFNSFTMFPAWTEDGKIDNGGSTFTLNDLEANTSISFRMKNNVVVEISVYMDEDGC